MTSTATRYDTEYDWALAVLHGTGEYRGARVEVTGNHLRLARGPEEATVDLNVVLRYAVREYLDGIGGSPADWALDAAEELLLEQEQATLDEINSGIRDRLVRQLSDVRAALADGADPGSLVTGDEAEPGVYLLHLGYDYDEEISRWEAWDYDAAGEVHITVAWSGRVGDDIKVMS